jgi:hypothetical protein
MIHTIKLQISPDAIRGITNHTARAIAGTEPDIYRIGERYWSAVAYSLFESIFKAFLAKSRHEVDELGQSWKDHDPKTKAYSRMDARRSLTLYDNRAVRTPTLRVRPTLPPSVNRQWGGRWYGLFIQLTSKHGESDDSAKKIAGGSTWEYFKAMGYPTLLSLTQNMKLPILNRTGTLQRSVFPAPLSGGFYLPIDRNQVVRIQSGKLEIGTNRPNIADITRERPLWPRDISLWINRANAAGRDAIHEYLPIVLQQL